MSTDNRCFVELENVSQARLGLEDGKAYPHLIFRDLVVLRNAATDTLLLPGENGEVYVDASSPYTVEKISVDL